MDSASNSVGTDTSLIQVTTMPFTSSGDPVILPATTTAQQYTINQPTETTSFRFVNPCGFNIRIKSVASLSKSVTAITGTQFLARTSETVASTPAPTNPRIVSIMTTADPGANGCAGELQHATRL